MKVLITQSNYIPWKGYFDAINLADICVLYDDVQFTKRDWRNRNIIKTNNRTEWLSIPVITKGKYLQKISDTIVADNQWGRNHWNKIMHNYLKAPYFDEISNILKNYYLECPHEYLSTINKTLIESINKYLGIKTTMLSSNDFILRGDKSEKLVNICLELGASEYYSGPKAHNYLNIELFAKNGIQVSWLDYDNYKEYKQLTEPFEHHVSIIDLLFNCGPNSINYMKSFKI